MFKIVNRQNSAGFTILEIIVVISIVTVGLLGVSSLVVQNIQGQAVSQNYIIASMLAQEALEIVRVKRDTNWLQLAADEWLDLGGSRDLVRDGDYTVDYEGNMDDTPDDCVNAKLYFTTAGFYTHAVTAYTTPFCRLVSVTETDIDLDIITDKISVTATVGWEERGRSQSYVASMDLYDWY